MMTARRAFCLIGFLALTALAACKMSSSDAPADAPAEGGAITGPAIEVTPLDGPAAAPAAATPPAEATPATPATPAPAAKPADAEKTTDAETPAEDAAAEAPETPPLPPKSAAQKACERGGGQWMTAVESGAKSCVRTTRDAGQSCTRGSQCEGDCLARSGTCSPISPLFGCNEILQDNGVRTTLCRD